MKRPKLYPFWLEAEISPGVWDAAWDGPAGCATLQDARQRVQELRLAARWAEAAFRVVTPDGALVLEVHPDPVHTSAGGSRR